jgi:putative RNA 2'-phosphotransferase
MDAKLVKISKFLSLVLRHQPELIGLELDPQGWADVAELLDRAARHGKPITREQLEQAIATNDKQRFALSPDGTRIRANQGHSVEVDLGLVPQEPPELLYHGTARQFLEPIRAEGLVAGKRQHVHLSADVPTALKVGSRHGQPVPLTVRAGAMHRDGLAFYRSENGVWLTDNVPPEFIVFP